ncbi:MAG: DUF2130 domain-containing protein [Saprospiraceae bacterium]|nr:DUF2130 domain-containing protein [Saprospiraceae bacterium]
MVESKENKVGESSISCPSCGHNFDVEKALEQKAEQRLRNEFNQRFLQLKKNLDEEKNLLDRERLEVKRLSSQTWEIIQEELKKERIRLAEQMKAESQKHWQHELEKLSRALEQKERENLTLQKKELSLLAERQKLENERQSLQLKFEREYLHRQQEMEKNIRNQFRDQHNFMRLEYEKKLNDQKNLIEEMTRKIEQGSMKMQGEIQEIAIEEFLKERFIGDTVTEIKSGVRGADCMLHIYNQGQGQEVGKIYFESKRTKNFQNAWIEKFKSDMRHQKADLGILVTQVMPSGMEHMGERDGVWICTFEEMKILVPILRDSVRWVSEAAELGRNQESKMSMLYNYLTSNEFKMQMEAIVEGFTQLKEELDREKRAMHAIWKRREKQIDKVLINTNHLYGSIKGIAGNEIQTIKALEIE